MAKDGDIIDVMFGWMVELVGWLFARMIDLILWCLELVFKLITFLIVGLVKGIIGLFKRDDSLPQG